MAGLMDQAVMGQPQQGPVTNPAAAPPVEDPALAQGAMPAALPGEEMPEAEDGDMYSWTENATPEEQKEYENVLRAVSVVLYDDDKTHNSMMQMLQASGEPTEGIAKAAVTLITQVDKQVQIPEVVLLDLAGDVFDMLNELGNKAQIFNLTPEQEKVGLAATQETLLRSYGLSEEDLTNLAQGLGQQDVNELAGIYGEATNGEGMV